MKEGDSRPAQPPSSEVVRLVLLLTIAGFVILPAAPECGSALMASGLALVAVDRFTTEVGRRFRRWRSTRRVAKRMPTVRVVMIGSPQDVCATLYGCQSPLHTEHIRRRLEDPGNRFPIG